MHIMIPWLLSLPGTMLTSVADIAVALTAPIALPAPTPTPAPTGALSALSPTVMVRGLTLGAVSFILGLIVGKPVINWLRDRRIGKHIRIEGPERHQVKTGTPTMGGLI